MSNKRSKKKKNKAEANSNNQTVNKIELAAVATEADNTATETAETAETQEAENTATKTAETAETQEAENTATETAETAETQEAENTATKTAETAETQEAENTATETAETAETQEAENTATETAETAETQEAENTATETEEAKKPNRFIRIVKCFVPWKGDDVFDIVRKLIFIGALTAFIIVAIPFFTDMYEMQRDEKISQEIAQIYIPLSDDELADLNDSFDTEEVKTPKVLPSFEKLLEINPNVVGFIDIDGTSVSYPVVQGKDNDYYLTHDIYNNVNKSGTIMMDYRNVVSGDDNQSDNLVLYGHNMAIGTYFASLNEYWRTLYDSNSGGSISYYKEHPVIRFDTIYEQSEWKIFAIGLYNTNREHGDVYEYIDKLNFSSRTEFNDFIINVMDRSDIFTDVDIRYGDDILTLSTCCWPYKDNNYIRLVVFARKVRDGESSAVNVDVAKVNTYVKRWKWVYDLIGGGYDWSQSNWDRRKLLSYTKQDALRDGYTFLED